MRSLRFAKMHGTGNDFVVVDCLDGDPVDDWRGFARRVLDRHFGIGGDQLLLVQRSDVAEFRMGIRNADGSEAEMCGNGIRCFLKHVRDRGYTDEETVRVETLGGVVTPRWLGDDRVEIEMGRPVLDPEKIPTLLHGAVPLLDVPLRVGDRTLAVTPVSMGNPHCVLFVEDPEREEVQALGPSIEHHPEFPARTNVEFVSAPSRRELRQRTWERGVGETLSCGSGACAAMVAAVLTGRADNDAVVRLRGGELRIRWAGPDSAVFLAGPASHVFDGEIPIP